MWSRLLANLRRPSNGWGRLRWLLVPIIGADTTVTLLGQPASYWSKPLTGEEGNDLFAWFLVRGPGFFLVTSAGYILFAVLVVTFLPRRLALAGFLAYTLGHFFGACSWLSYHFGCGMWLIVTYAIGLSLLIASELRAEESRPASGG